MTTPNNIQDELKPKVRKLVGEAGFGEELDGVTNRIMQLITEHTRKEVESVLPDKKEPPYTIHDPEIESLRSFSERIGYNQAIDDIRASLNKGDVE